MSPNLARANTQLAGELLTEVLAGLRAPQKQLPCKLFYDERGAELFERICELPEYYPTRTEMQIMRTHGSEMAAWIGERARIIEFGSGSGDKTRMLLSEVHDPAEYVPIDIEQHQLYSFAWSLARTFPHLRVRPVNADYTQPLELPELEVSCRRRIVYFPGSTIGNFDSGPAVAFLRNAAELCGPSGGLLIGVDLRKDRSILEPAYNDAAGVTAAFNLNLLSHINRVCDADFQIGAFRHRAIYDEVYGRIEMHLVSCVSQVVKVGGEQISFDVGEHIVTEHSYKYTIDGFRELASVAGFTPHKVWTDPQHRFSVHAFDIS